MDELAKFACLSDKLLKFQHTWIMPLEKKCDNNNASSQQKASYYIWARYSLSMNTLRHICKIESFPDLCVIIRCCLEFSASLQAVLSDEKAADDYVEFEKHAKSKYLRLLNGASNNQRAIQLETHLSELGVDNPNDYKWTKWCARLNGITSLIKEYKPEAYPLYSIFSDFAHGSIIAIKILQNLQPSTALLEKPIRLVYSDYIISTKAFLDKAWGPIVTQDGERCKEELHQVAQLFC